MINIQVQIQVSVLVADRCSSSCILKVPLRPKQMNFIAVLDVNTRKRAATPRCLLGSKNHKHFLLCSGLFCPSSTFHVRWEHQHTQKNQYFNLSHAMSTSRPIWKFTTFVKNFINHPSLLQGFFFACVNSGNIGTDFKWCTTFLVVELILQKSITD